MIDITGSALNHFIELLSMQTKYNYIRIFISNINTLDAECSIIFCDAKGLKKDDILFTFSKLLVYIDYASMPYLKDAKIDLEVNDIDSKLIIYAPFIKGLFDDLSLKDKVKYFLINKIVPQLILHGGNIKLVRITKDKYVVVKFTGGCNGCSMVNYTLKDNIELKLLKYIPELRGVLDITDHIRHKRSFY
ncbi:NifU family protein [Candidatus Purcelliella pentastirinorum]|uniref:NifU family protein n=1 Tax=Candidatus Purcelliella pentastirinorum TaxID=472834 RepID=UPI002367A2BD|nr:NifU family protein [Candidatus Purcelliella pentastirinorum]WDI78816.1 NifU family protein [Candidatus Purcelliella pentastirinorum]WDR79949.1 NifU family protein [Candidatus Purcelliella pentastirinorum]